MTFLRENKEIIRSIGLIVIPLALLFSFYGFTKEKQHEPKILSPVILKNTDPFESINIIAKSAIVKDINTGEILFDKRSDLSLPLASITKLLTVLTVDKLSNKNIVQISLDDLLTEGDSNLYPGESFTKKDLIDFTLIVSSNDGASALAANALSGLNYQNPKERQDAFIREMNKTAKLIGMEDSYFYNETGLDNSDNRAGAYGSASDVAKLFEYILENNKVLLESTSKDYSNFVSNQGLIHPATNTNEIVNSLPNLIASKTGFTDLAGGNLGVVIDPSLNRPFVIVVLGSTADGRFDDITKLSNATIDYLKK